jgi:hypothetical protein
MYKYVKHSKVLMLEQYRGQSLWKGKCYSVIKVGVYNYEVGVGRFSRLEWVERTVGLVFIKLL